MCSNRLQQSLSIYSSTERFVFRSKETQSLIPVTSHKINYVNFISQDGSIHFYRNVMCPKRNKIEVLN